MKISKLAKTTMIFLGAAALAFTPAINSTALGTFMGAIQTQAAEQSYTWVQEGEIWRLKDAAGDNVVNTWYQDATGARYYLDSNGVMQTGVLNRNGHYYYLEDSGKMVTVDGIYNGVNLTFNQDVNSTTYGEITSGTQELIDASEAAQQQSSSQKGSIFPDNPYPYQEVTLSNGYVSYWDPTFGMWMHKSGEMVKGDERPAHWDADTQALAEQVGRAMAEQNK